MIKNLGFVFNCSYGNGFKFTKEKEYGQLNSAVPLLIAEEIANQKFCEFESTLEGIDAGIRVAFAYMTLGVVASPLEGYTHLTIGKTKEGKEYFIISNKILTREVG